ncbi:hypothetical protein BV25DRAFT_1548430 [Artomyces pyxidatus]|uniref:Uncharacterized protein n=1 Tax=Artomyces pyxidatus TaxID=48021 RepID=A0ACB8SLC6_9AGAM|nr:hypothetical protein BV25DRAFT_1548430 [Artomyces pyxidatus]
MSSCVSIGLLFPFGKLRRPAGRNTPIWCPYRTLGWIFQNAKLQRNSLKRCLSTLNPWELVPAHVLRWTDLGRRYAPYCITSTIWLQARIKAGFLLACVPRPPSHIPLHIRQNPFLAFQPLHPRCRLPSTLLRRLPLSFSLIPSSGAPTPIRRLTTERTAAAT